MAKTVRWVQYEAAVFVRVEADENGDTTIAKVVTANDVGELRLARDDHDQYMIYDENFERVRDDFRLDGFRAAVSVAEDRGAWPAKEYPAWDDGPDPRRFPDLYEDEDEFEGEDDEDDELEPLLLR